jgi:hypothetical protein
LPKPSGLCIGGKQREAEAHALSVADTDVRCKATSTARRIGYQAARVTPACSRRRWCRLPRRRRRDRQGIARRRPVRECHDGRPERMARRHGHAWPLPRSAQPFHCAARGSVALGDRERHDVRCPPPLKRDCGSQHMMAAMALCCPCSAHDSWEATWTAGVRPSLTRPSRQRSRPVTPRTASLCGGASRGRSARAVRSLAAS